MKKEIFLVASGDLRIAANQNCWETQDQMEQTLAISFAKFGYSIKRAHAYDPEKKHGFIDSQRMGIEVFKNIDKDAPLIVAESVWQYSHHVLAGLTTHRGPILTVANFSGQWPGLVGMLNLNGSLTKANVNYSSLWSVDFNDEFFLNGIKDWLETGTVKHSETHVKSFASVKIPAAEEQLGREFAAKLKNDKAIMGVFDEGCMGMFNAIVPDDLLHATGIFKERLSQSTLYAKMLTVSDADAEKVLNWLLDKGMKFDWGTDDATELTKNQTLIQCKMYIAALHLADEFGCDTIGIQYQQGLKDLVPASDLVEGLLNNQDRPPVYNESGKELYAGEALPHFNEVDECAGIDGLLTYRLWQKLGMPGENTLHDLRWGENFKSDRIDDFVWVFEISGAAPPAHHVGGYAGSDSIRQPAMFFKFGGGSLRGVAKPGNIVWSRIYILNNELHCDLGVGKAVELPKEETDRRWKETNYQWPMMHATLDGVSRDQMMARHKANHIQVVYVNDQTSAHKACRIKAAALEELGIKTHFCGNVDTDGSKFN
ncbi:fucose isomerase [Pedobacter sp. ASV28]|uniref:fucose isomerase n=1 Tax=Pedobacter sp. ASV28 TaxID=2795123 RepID=UPI0018ED7C21|nr:fucose isomerase [Pedobacter sp. ASV28]